MLVGAGDISSCGNHNDEATAKLLDTLPGTVFVLGDNVYIDGTYREFADCYDPTWGRHKDRTKPVPGNHEYFTPGAAGYFQYFNNIPAYYAYDLGSWRIYALNSEIDVSSTGAQLKWLKKISPPIPGFVFWHTGTNHAGHQGTRTAVTLRMKCSGKHFMTPGQNWSSMATYTTTSDLRR